MESSKRVTVVGVFDDYQTAERVAREIENTGISRDSIDIESNFRTGAAGRSEYREHEGGGITGFFNRLFGSGDQNETGHYAEAVRRGSAVLCVTAPKDQVDRAADIMNDRGAIDIDERVGEYRKSGYTRFDPDASNYTVDEASQERERFRGGRSDTSIPVIEEELQIGKRAVRRGGVRVYSHVVEKPVEESVTLREEHVSVERRPTNRPVSSADVANMRDRSIEMTEMAEEPVVQKRARVREEVILGKETTERTEKIQDKVRHTEVDVQPLAASGVQDTDFRRDYDTRFARSGVSYDALRPAYDFGYRAATEDRYRGRRWADIEPDLRRDYSQSHPQSNWDEAKDAIRYGWEKVTGKR